MKFKNLSIALSEAQAELSKLGSKSENIGEQHLSIVAKGPEKGAKITLNLQGQTDGTVEACEINGQLMIPTEEGAVYLSAEQAIHFFRIGIEGRGVVSSDDSWDTAVEAAFKNAQYVFKGSCSHTEQGIDYLRALLQNTYRPTLRVDKELVEKFDEASALLAGFVDIVKIGKAVRLLAAVSQQLVSQDAEKSSSDSTK